MFSMKPRIDDWSPLAKFYYANEALRRIANELDSIDGRRDPDRCQQLIARYRGCQDRVLLILDEIMTEAFPNESDRAPRDFRVKFPDDIMHENFSGQLWFGAECLSVGSNIVDREFESEALRPLAKVLVNKLEILRKALKGQSLKSVYAYPDTLREKLKDFDTVFADFEFSYVSAMVPVKSVNEYEMQLEVAVLFSEALMKSVRLGYIKQAMIDDCDPSIMFTLPRLAIVYGLLDQQDGPLRVDKPSDQLPEMFRPFRSLLQKIRDLLRTLTVEELIQLESALSSQDGAHTFATQSTDITSIVDYRNREKLPSKTGFLKSPNLASALIDGNNSEPKPTTESSSNSNLENMEEATGSTSGMAEKGRRDSTSSSSDDESCSSTEDVSFGLDVEEEKSIQAGELSNRLVENSGMDGGWMEEKEEEEMSGARASQGDNAEDVVADMVRIRNTGLRARFRSPEDLIHRLFVCVAGVADQWQSNYPSDLRAILKMVLHSGEVPNVYEVHGKTARTEGREEEIGVEVGENISSGSPSPTATNTGILAGAAAGVPWVADNECSSCSACHVQFTLVRRRHHCRNCGKIFCGRCSRNTAPLPKYGYEKPVRVCNQCFFYKLIPFGAATTPSAAVVQAGEH